MKRMTILTVGGILTLAASGCSTCPNPYDYTGPVQSGGYAPAGVYPQPAYYPAPGAVGAAQPANNGYVGQPTPAPTTARLTPVEGSSGATTQR